MRAVKPEMWAGVSCAIVYHRQKETVINPSHDARQLRVLDYSQSNTPNIYRSIRCAFITGTYWDDPRSRQGR